MRDLLLAFFLGVLIAGGVAAWYEINQMNQVSNSLKLLKSGEYAAAYTRAMSAYRQEQPAIAIWELTHLLQTEHDELELGIDRRASLTELMLTHARLAKLYQQQGQEAQAQTNAQQAISFMQQLPKPDTTVTNLPSLLARLQEFDARENLRRDR